MNLKYYRCYLAWLSFRKNLISYFTLNFIKLGFLNGIFLSAFIFLTYLNNFINLNSNIISNLGLIIAILGFYRLLGSSRIIYFWTGFFVGIFWFYWMSFSLYYYELLFLAPFLILAIGLIYGFIFYFVGLFKNSLLQIFALVIINFIHPFGFNWLNFALIFVDTLFKPNFITFLILLFCIYFFKENLKFKFIIPLALLFCLNLNYEQNYFNIKIYLANTQIPQDEKWERKNTIKFVKEILVMIDKASKEHYDFIVLPETALPLILDKHKGLIEILKNKSKNIAILVGSLGLEKGEITNSAYFFNKGNYRRLDKTILVPFGEEIPLPFWLKNFINKNFFDGAKDIKAAKEISKFKLKNYEFTNAICYEATHYEIYKNYPKFVVAISNNAWFYPSTEMTLQRLLMKYYSSNFNTMIFHSSNKSKSELIRP